VAKYFRPRTREVENTVTGKALSILPDGLVKNLDGSYTAVDANYSGVKNSKWTTILPGPMLRTHEPRKNQDAFDHGKSANQENNLPSLGCAT
jgi:hypothetical protein